MAKTDRWLIAVMAPIGLLQLYIIGTSPISGGDREAARTFVAQNYAARAIHPAGSATASAAVVYHLIRSGDSETAARAMRFAAESRLGFGCPYAIERLEGNDPTLRDAASAYLRAISGRDYGVSVAAWRQWWRNPPRPVLGLVIGQRSAELGALALGVIAPLVFWRVGRLVRAPGGRPDLLVCATVSLTYGLFMGFVLLSLRLVGGYETCQFGAETIAYHSIHGRVVGLEDARLGSGGLWVGLVAGFLMLWFVGIAGLTCTVIARHRDESHALRLTNP